MQVYCSVLLGSFSFEAEKAELESSASELLCFDVCHHFGKCGFICEPLTEGLNGPGLTNNRRKTAKTLVDSRKN